MQHGARTENRPQHENFSHSLPEKKELHRTTLVTLSAVFFSAHTCERVFENSFITSHNWRKKERNKLNIDARSWKPDAAEYFSDRISIHICRLFHSRSWFSFYFHDDDSIDWKSEIIDLKTFDIVGELWLKGVSERVRVISPNQISITRYSNSFERARFPRIFSSSSRNFLATCNNFTYVFLSFLLVFIFTPKKVFFLNGKNWFLHFFSWMNSSFTFFPKLLASFFLYPSKHLFKLFHHYKFFILIFFAHFHSRIFLDFSFLSSLLAEISDSFD